MNDINERFNTATPHFNLQRSLYLVYLTEFQFDRRISAKH